MSRSGVVEWRQAELVEAIAAEVSENLEIAAKVIEVDARRRLLAIRQPEFGAKYRRLLALFRLTSQVRRDGKIIEAQIGIPRGDQGDSYGWWIEKGSKSAAAHPWLLPALLTNLRKALALVRGE